MADLRITSQVQGEQIRRLMQQLQGKRFHQALSVGLNGAARQVMARSARVVAKRMGLSAKDARGQFRVNPFATPDHLTAAVRGSGKRLPLAEFKARQTANGATAAPWAQRRLFKGTFIARMRSGHEGVFKRTSKRRLPIKELYGPGIAATMAEKVVQDELVEYGEERITANVMRQLERYARVRRRPGGKR